MDNWVLNPLPGALVQSQRSWTGSTPTGHPLDPSPGDNHHHPLDPRPITWSSSSPKSAPPNHHQNHQHHQQCHHHQNRHLPRSPTTWFSVKCDKSLCTWSIPTLRPNIKSGSDCWIYSLCLVLPTWIPGQDRQQWLGRDVEEAGGRKVRWRTGRGGCGLSFHPVVCKEYQKARTHKYLQLTKTRNTQFNSGL